MRAYLSDIVRQPTTDATNLVLEDHTEHAVIFIGNASGKKDLSIAQEKQSPEPVEIERLSENIPRRALEAAGNRVINIYFAITEIPDPELAVYNFKTPGSVKFSI